MGVGVSLAPPPGHQATCCCRLLLAFTLLVTRPQCPLVGGHAETPTGVRSSWETALRGLSMLTVMPRRWPMWSLPALWAVSLFWRREERLLCLPLKGEGGHQWPCGLCEVPGLDCLTYLGFPCLVLILMLEVQPLCTSAKRNLRDRVLGDVEKNSFIALSGKGGHSSLMPSSLCGPTQEGLVRSCGAAVQGRNCC